MKKFIFWITIFSCFGCSAQLTNESVTLTLPVKYSDSFVQLLTTTSGMISYKNQVMLELPVGVTESLDDSLVLDTVKYDYFIYNRSDKFGYLYKSFTDPNPAKKNISEIVNRTVQPFPADTILNYIRKKDMPAATDFTKRTFSFAFSQEGYDSIYVSVDKNLDKLHYSFSPKLDSVFGGRIYKITFLASKDGSSNAEYSNQFRETSIQLKKTECANQKEIIKLFNRAAKY